MSPTLLSTLDWVASHSLFNFQHLQFTPEHLTLLCVVCGSRDNCMAGAFKQGYICAHNRRKAISHMTIDHSTSNSKLQGTCNLCGGAHCNKRTIEAIYKCGNIPRNDTLSGLYNYSYYILSLYIILAFIIVHVVMILAVSFHTDVGFFIYHTIQVCNAHQSALTNTAGNA